MTNRYDHGRSLLRRWHAAKPRNFYDDDRYLRMALARRLDAKRLAAAEPALRQAGGDSAGPIDRASFVLDRPEHLPRVEPWSPLGERTDDVVFHPAYHDIGRLRGDSDDAALHVRGLMTRVARIMQVALLLDDAQHAGDADGVGWLGAAAQLLLDRFVRPDDDAVADGYPALIREIVEG